MQTRRVAVAVGAVTVGWACGLVVGRIDDPGPAPLLQLLAGCLCAVLAPQVARLAPRGNELWLGLLPVAAMFGALLWCRSGQLSVMAPTYSPVGGRPGVSAPFNLHVDGTWTGVALIWVGVALAVSMYVRAARREAEPCRPGGPGAAGGSRSAAADPARDAGPRDP